MDAEQLRALIRALIPWLDDATQARLMNEVVNRAARASSGWSLSTPSERRVEEIEAFVAAARRVHQADPNDVDDYLREGTHAFLARVLRHSTQNSTPPRSPHTCGGGAMHTRAMQVCGSAQA